MPSLVHHRDEKRRSQFTFLMARRFPSVKPGKREMKFPTSAGKTSTAPAALSLSINNRVAVAAPRCLETLQSIQAIVGNPRSGDENSSHFLGGKSRPPIFYLDYGCVPRQRRRLGRRRRSGAPEPLHYRSCRWSRHRPPAALSCCANQPQIGREMLLERYLFARSVSSMFVLA